MTQFAKCFLVVATCVSCLQVSCGSNPRPEGSGDPAPQSLIGQVRSDLVISIGPDIGGSMNFTRCATNGQTCVMGGTRNVAYGAQATGFRFKNLTGNFSCSTTTFGGF